MAAASSSIIHGRLIAALDASEMKQWYADWPPNGAPAPRVGDRFNIALGGAESVGATLAQLAFLQTCQASWIVGVATADSGESGLLQSPMAALASSVSPQAIFIARPAEESPQGAAPPAHASKGDIGPAIFSTDPNPLLTAEARRRIEQGLNLRMEADYTSLLSQRQALYQQTHPTPFADVEGNTALLRGAAKLVYSLQRVDVAKGAARYYARAQWRAEGKNVYFIRAWLTPEFGLESVVDSGIPEGADARNIEARGGSAKQSEQQSSDIANVFDGSLVRLVEHVGLIEMEQPGNLFVMRQAGQTGVRYDLMRWTPEGLLPVGASFGAGC